MAKYIDKDALVAEIEKHLSYYKDLKDRGVLSKEGEAAYRVVRILKSDIDSLEVKEVDLQSEIDRVWDNTSDNFSEDGWKEFEDIAKHFFELGLRASNPLTWEDVRDIDDLLDESLPSSFSDELELKGYYEEVLKRFKAKKGE